MSVALKVNFFLDAPVLSLMVTLFLELSIDLFAQEEETARPGSFAKSKSRHGDTPDQSTFRKAKTRNPDGGYPLPTGKLQNNGYPADIRIYVFYASRAGSG